MNYLVSYGVSSDSESEGDADEGNNGTVGSANDGKPSVNKTRNFLLESGSASSESDSEAGPERENIELSAAATPSLPRQKTFPATPLSSPTPNKLPPPPLESHSGSSVFANPFKVQADQKLNALQKHVPLTVLGQPSQIGGKRMCVAYRKDGRCRFGIKCKFAHDSDLQTSVIPSEFGSPVDSKTPGADKVDSHGRGQSSTLEKEQEDTPGEGRRKRRVGLSNTLVPPKRAMKQYAMQKKREQLNLS